jgi:ABC-type arginine/histidine transport system permease subunit
MGFFETLLFFLIVIGLLRLMVLSINKFCKSRIPYNRKVLWIILFIVTPVIGLMIFLIYHENYLAEDMKA